MPGPVSDSHRGPGDYTPYVPSYLYPKGAKQCPCGHHEGYHNSAGQCLHAVQCHCTGLPADCYTSEEDFWS